MKELLQALSTVQKELKAPKGQYNSFAHYKYRNCEDILEAVKPLLNANNLALIIQDDIEQVGDRFYIVATCTIYHTETGDKLQTKARARETLDKKGMDQAQVTGATSSYARKYALNGLFLIDDTKDADSDEYKQEIDNRTQIKGQQQHKVDELTIAKQEVQAIAIAKNFVNAQGKLDVDKLKRFCLDKGLNLQSKDTNHIKKIAQELNKIA